MAESEDWPEYDLPADALADGVPSTESRSTREPVETPPTEEATPTPVADGTGTATDSKPTTDDSGDVVPRYRLDEVREQERKARAEREAFRAEADTLRRQMEELRNARPTPPPARSAEPTAPLTDDDRKTAAVRDGLFKLIPELKRLPDLVAQLERAGRWDEAAEATDTWRKAEKVFYDNHTDAQLNRLYDLAANVVLGQGKASSDLPQMMKGTIDHAFGRWVMQDAERRARYDALDTKLVDEFWPLFKSANIDPLRRSDSAAVMASVAGRPKLPVGGSQTGPPSAAVTKKQPSHADEDEDAIFEKSWEIAQSHIAKG